MKRHNSLGLAVALAVAGVWAARAAWRAHHDLVTLHVRNLPLAEVVARLERQTWEKIVTDSRLDAKITLNVDNAPLLEVLDRIGEQAGAMATTIHAIHKSPTAMQRLRDGLRQGDLAKASGWTNLAPRLNFLGAEPGEPPPDFPAPDEGRGKPFITEDRIIVKRVGERVSGPGSPEPSVSFVRREGAGIVHEEIITTERIVIETELESRSSAGANLTPDRATAQNVARQAQAKCETIYTLQQSSVAAIAGDLKRAFHSALPPNDAPRNGSPPPGPPSIEAAERHAQREQLSRFQNLTPEQRAQQQRPEFQP